MTRFINLTQIIDTGKKRPVSVNVDHIEFFYDQKVVFSDRAIKVAESYDEIKKELYK
jgi:hypothetical protein